MYRTVPTLIRSTALLAGVLAFTPLSAQDNAATPAAGAAEQSTPNQKLPAIIVTEATQKHLTDRVIATGTIRPVDEIYVQPLVDGLSIRTINVDIGSIVKAGSVLASLNEDDLVLQKSQLQANRAKAEAGLAQYRAQVVEAQANVDDARRQRDRTERLSQSGTTTVSQLEQANAQLEVAKARLNAANQAVAVGQSDVAVVDAQLEDVDLKLARTGVTTPVDGVVSAKNAKIGAIASGAGEPLFTVIKEGAIELVADLSETDIPKVQNGQRANVLIAGSRKPITGRVRLVSPTIDATTRLGTVHIIVDDHSTARAGMYASAEIIIAETDALALPLSAVTTGRSGSTARRVEGDVVKQVQVVIGIQDGGFVQIVSGLQPGDKVVAKAGAFVRDGDRITPVSAQPAAIVNGG
jgi:HlyD family secretion protein